MNNWWTDADAEAFKQKTDILVKQFDAIEVLPARGDQPAVFANGRSAWARISPIRAVCAWLTRHS